MVWTEQGEVIGQFRFQSKEKVPPWRKITWFEQSLTQLGYSIIADWRRRDSLLICSHVSPHCQEVPSDPYIASALLLNIVFRQSWNDSFGQVNFGPAAGSRQLKVFFESTRRRIRRNFGSMFSLHRTGSASMQRSVPLVLEKENQAQNSSDEPEQHIDQINPYRILHP